MSNFTLPLGIKSLERTAQTHDSQGNIIFDVKSNKTSTTCRICGKSISKVYEYGDILTIHHLPILDQPVFLRIRVVRYQCMDCDDHPTTAERYDWMERKAKTTKGFDRCINRQLIHSTVKDVSRKEKVSYEIVKSALQRHVKKNVDWTHYTELTPLGIDEIALRKGHNEYVVIVSSKNKIGKLSVIEVLPDRRKETIKTFMKSIPDWLKKTVSSVCTDMCDSFVQSTCEIFGERVVVIDRYHVSKLYREPLDQLRISEMKRLKKELSLGEYENLDNMMWIVCKKHECLLRVEKDQLALFYHYSPKLKQMHQAALKLIQIFNTHQARKVAFTRACHQLSQTIEAAK